MLRTPARKIEPKDLFQPETNFKTTMAKETKSSAPNKKSARSKTRRGKESLGWP